MEDEKYYCSCCGQELKEDEYYYFEDEIYCENCYCENVTTCDCCEDEIWRDDAIYTEDGGTICNDCYCDNYFTCCNCGEVHHYDYCNEYEGDCYCNECYEEICENNCVFDYYETTNRINNNIDKPLQQYYNCNAVCDYHENPIEFEKRKLENEQTKLFFGAELEITNKTENLTAKASHFIANNLFCRCEDDSSIDGYGFEIISDPATMEFWKSRKEKIKQVFDELKNNGYISHNADNCGLHIHASREGLGDTTEEQEKTIENIILICENFKEELKTFSRRKRFNWCRFVKDSSDSAEGQKETNIKTIKEVKNSRGRYQVINTNNSNTIEFRLNRGTLNIDTFFASLQLFYNIIELAKTNNFIGKTWKYLINMNNFSELKQYNKERNIKGYRKIIETSRLEELKQIEADKKAERKREQTKKIYDNLQEFRFDILKNTQKFENLYYNEFYNYCINSNNRSTITDLKYNLKNALSELNNYIDNCTKRHNCIDNITIYYYEFDKQKIIEYKNKIIKAYNEYKNNSIFQYIFGKSNDMELLKSPKNKSTYETIIILNTNRTSEQIENIKQLFKCNGHIIEIENIGIKNLAYELQGERQGDYYTIKYKTEPDKTQVIESHLHGMDYVLKYITVKEEN